MKFRKFLFITINDMFKALGKSVMYQSGFVYTTDVRIFSLENKEYANIESNLESVMQNRMIINSPELSKC